MTTSEQFDCAICLQRRAGGEKAALDRVDEALRAILAVNANGWEPGSDFCLSCLERFTRVSEHLARAFPSFSKQERKVLPTPLRMGAPERLTGRGVTVAFIDSGFYSHPDLVEPRNRILKYVNVIQRTRRSELDNPHDYSWHGMMTSVVAAGNGYLSGGLYRGIASGADVVLIRAGSEGRVRHEHIRDGLLWTIKNRRRYRIRVVNISCGGDREESYLTDDLSQAVEAATAAGLLVVAAAGNASHDSPNRVLPPASAPSAITVGGLDDGNTLEFERFGMYRSRYGPTIDGLQKPEVIAPGIWVAAPILPRTPTHEQAELLATLERTEDSELASIIRGHPGVDKDLDQSLELPPYLIRNVVWLKIRDNNVISGHYKHVDGTSFAAPIVSSIAAQILEARPKLTPQQVKLALIRTARRIPWVEADRQGWGIVNPAAAIEFAVQAFD